MGAVRIASVAIEQGSLLLSRDRPDRTVETEGFLEFELLSVRIVH